MIKIVVDDEKSTFEAAGSAVDLTKETCFLIEGIYFKLKESGSIDAADFYKESVGSYVKEMAFKSEKDKEEVLINKKNEAGKCLIDFLFKRNKKEKDKKEKEVLDCISEDENIDREFKRILKELFGE